MLTRDRIVHHPSAGINHERIVINYENSGGLSNASVGTFNQKAAFGFDHAERAASRDSDAASTDSGKPPSLSGKQPRPTSFRNEFLIL